jgi:hypothetical protein
MFMKYRVKLRLHSHGPGAVDGIWLKGACKVEILSVNKTVDKDSLIMNFLERNLWSNRFGNHLQNIQTMTEDGWNYMLSCSIFKESEDSFGQHVDSIPLQALHNRNRTILKTKLPTALGRKQTISTERPLLVGKVSANFCG